MVGNYGGFGAGYLPTGAGSSPGLYNQALWDQRWLPSWASLKGGIMGPLYAPQITDPATVQAIMAGSWDFSTAGSMFDPQGNYDLVPGAVPNHFYSGRSMTLRGYGAPDEGGIMGTIRGIAAKLSNLLPFDLPAFFYTPFGAALLWGGYALLALAVIQPRFFVRSAIGRWFRSITPRFMRRGLSRSYAMVANRGKKKSRRSRRRSR